MEAPKKKRARPSPFPNHVSVYESEEGLRLITALCEKRGLSQSALLRQLVREEAKRQGISQDGAE